MWIFVDFVREGAVSGIMVLVSIEGPVFMFCYIMVFVGLEGGWSDMEYDSLLQWVSMGDFVLRAEIVVIISGVILVVLRSGLVFFYVT